ncbi:MAG: GGDEF domain-containing protein, partial [Myxococcota bacterium]
DESDGESDLQWIDQRTEPVSIVPIPGAVSGLSPCLVVMTNPHLGQVIPLAGGPVTVGRGQDANFTLRESSISRVHICLTDLGDGRVELEDLGSTNGTFINGERVTRCELRAGDRIQLGRSTVVKLDFMGELEGDFHSQLYEAGTRDALTGLFNRRYFEQHLDPEFRLAHRHSEALTLILIDLDHFKGINDEFGHIAGDLVLRSFATLLQKRCRREDIIARYGGEEFVLLLRRTDPNGATVLGEAVRQLASETVLTFQEQRIRFTVSLGAATSGAEHRFEDGLSLLQAADDALYRAKQAGRNKMMSH